MKEILITSSVLILAVMLLRWAFRGRVSHGLIYSAWLLVAARLLIPVQLGSFDFSVLNPAEPLTDAMGQIAQTPVSGQSQAEIRQEVELDYFVRGEDLMPQIQEILEQEKLRNPDLQIESVYEQILQERPREEVFTPEAQTKIEQAVQNRFVTPTFGQIAVWIWITGAAVMGAWFLWVNLSFAAKLRRGSEPVERAGLAAAVQVSRMIQSPCLFGFLRPTVWLTPQCLEDEARLRHVLAHELTHRKHWDHIWSLVRCVCLCVYWFNPLVWVAASLSKRDCELACDEAALKQLGESERIGYGKTLVDMVAGNVSAGQLLETATAMHETKKQLKARVNFIAKKPKVLAAAVAVLVLILAIVTGCTFAGQKETTPELSVPDPTEITDATQPTEVTQPTETTQFTQQTEPRPSELDVFPAVPPMETIQEKPEAMTADEFIVTVYEKKVDWKNGSASVRVPAFLPVTQVAVAANREIIQYLSPVIEVARVGYKTERNWVIEVDYSVICVDNAVGVLICVNDRNNTHYYRYFFDILTGERLSDLAFARKYEPNVEYPQLLYALNKLFNNPEGTYSNLTSFVLNIKDNITSLPWGLEPTAKQVSYDTLKAMQYDKEYCYRWLFSLHKNGSTAELQLLLRNAFVDAPMTFINYLSQESTGEFQKSIAKTLVAGTDLDDYVDTVCRKIIDEYELSKNAEYLIYYLNRNGFEKGEKELQDREISGKTEITDFNYQICYVENWYETGYFPQFNPSCSVIDEWRYTNYESPLDYTVKDALRPKSYNEIVASYDDQFFEDYFLICITFCYPEDKVPEITKVIASEDCWWTAQYLVYMDCTEEPYEKLQMMQMNYIFIEIPRAYYREFVVEDNMVHWAQSDAGAVLNGIYFDASC